MVSPRWLALQLPWLCVWCLCSEMVSGFQPAVVLSLRLLPMNTERRTQQFMSDDWSSFQAFDDDEDQQLLYGRVIDKQEYATEDDPQFVKEAVGAARKAPDIDREAVPIQVASGSQLELTEETVLGVLAACRGELGTLFGYSAENRGVGITGGVDYVDMDGPTVILRLKGRFWHTRTAVLDRVTNYLQQRIPEIVSVEVEDPWQLTNEANEVW